jgi:hypothetical protein
MRKIAITGQHFGCDDKSCDKVFPTDSAGFSLVQATLVRRRRVRGLKVRPSRGERLLLISDEALDESYRTRHGL